MNFKLNNSNNQLKPILVIFSHSSFSDLAYEHN